MNGAASTTANTSESRAGWHTQGGRGSERSTIKNRLLATHHDHRADVGRRRIREPLCLLMLLSSGCTRSGERLRGGEPPSRRLMLPLLPLLRSVLFGMIILAGVCEMHIPRPAFESAVGKNFIPRRCGSCVPFQ
mmetsp:Transcript_6301/g.19660  ORF Transcript_6301/g.19660 Transcript_6301/m.19660 type:complete len:134 (-) Transcript_6301:378-779(-)|eukprot:scaffold185184_cov29-Tisochrysis_lutea.AAC.5